jgi:hypothetical protein
MKVIGDIVNRGVLQKKSTIKTITKNEFEVYHNADGIWLDFWLGICRKYHKVEFKKRAVTKVLQIEDPTTR